MFAKPSWRKIDLKILKRNQSQTKFIVGASSVVLSEFIGGTAVSIAENPSTVGAFIVTDASAVGDVNYANQRHAYQRQHEAA